MDKSYQILNVNFLLGLHSLRDNMVQLYFCARSYWVFFENINAKKLSVKIEDKQILHKDVADTEVIRVVKLTTFSVMRYVCCTL